MKIEENAVFLTVPCADFCESPYRYSGFDLKITPPFDDRLAEVADKLFGKAAIVFDDGGRKISVGQAAEATRWIYIKQPVFLEHRRGGGGVVGVGVSGGSWCWSRHGRRTTPLRRLWTRQSGSGGLRDGTRRWRVRAAGRQNNLRNFAKGG